MSNSPGTGSWILLIHQRLAIWRIVQRLSGVFFVGLPVPSTGERICKSCPVINSIYLFLCF